jgi:hypothetical protein
VSLISADPPGGQSVVLKHRMFFCPCTEDRIVHDPEQECFVEHNRRVIIDRPAPPSDLRPEHNATLIPHMISSALLLRADIWIHSVTYFGVK